MNVNLIVAVDKNTHGIGKNGRIPWNNKGLLFFYIRGR